MKAIRCAALVSGLLSIALAARADQPSVDELLQTARQAFQEGRTDEAVKAAEQAIAAAPKEPRTHLLRGVLHQLLNRHEAAIADFDQVLKLDPKAADVYNRRGAEKFKLGLVEASIADFDRFIELRPDQERSHWQRGISYYYAGRFADGAKQFEGYQTFDDNDVENAVWRYLCMARDIGVEKARAEILKIKNDPRVPMMEIYRLYAGQAQPADVLAAAKAGAPGEKELNSRLFYAHLYLGLYYEAAGDKKSAQEHISLAADKHKIGHYMWDVARVHANRLRGLKAANP